MEHHFKKIWNWMIRGLLVVVLIFAMLLVGVRLGGVKVYTVISGSMEPTYSTGSLIYVKDVDQTQLLPGDVITFRIEENLVVTHRIYEIVAEPDSTEIYFRTKGDANEAVDGSLVSASNVIGVPFFSIPYLGYIAGLVQNPPGRYLVSALIAALLLGCILPMLFEKEKEE